VGRASLRRDAPSSPRGVSRTNVSFTREPLYGMTRPGKSYADASARSFGLGTPGRDA
jgi:hypothetical protein